MISYQQALEQVLDLKLPMHSEWVNLEQCLGRILSQDLYADFDLPRFDNSAVDGYALADLHHTEFEIVDRIRAGGELGQALVPGQAARIFTGAPLPQGAVAVVMQEHTDVKGSRVHLTKTVYSGQNIRRRGEEISQGQLVLGAPICINPATLGLIATLGLNRVQVYASLATAIWSTGDEVVQPGESLAAGQIYNANGPALQAAAREIGLDPRMQLHLADTPQAVQIALEQSADCNLILSAGGVSVGDFDHIREGVLANGFKEIFWKVAIKPGKPFFVAQKGQQIFMGLPGNPVAALVMMQIFVRPWILKLYGLEMQELWADAPLAQAHRHAPGRLEWCRASFNAEGQLIPHRAQGSHMLSALAQAEALVQLPGEEEHFVRGQSLHYLKVKWRA